MRYQQFLMMEYAQRCGMSWFSREYNKSRSNRCPSEK